MIIEDVNYFKYIFKKTEKISCAVFYILRSGSSVPHKDAVTDDLESAARDVLNVSLASLSATSATVRSRVLELRFALLTLESKLRVAHAAQYVDPEVLNVFLHEIDSVYRSMKRYTETEGMDVFVDGRAEPEVRTERKPARVREPKAVDPLVGGGPASPAPVSVSRRDRIIDILRDNPWATIKDISSAITDCSEKTIQRELISMINDNVVVREGERRWSKYKLV